MAIEGMKVVGEAMKSGLRFKAIVVNEDEVDIHQTNYSMNEGDQNTEFIALPDEVFRSAVHTENPQGIAALVFPVKHSLKQLLSQHNALFVIVAGLQDPGNLGTIIRSAEAFGAAGLTLGEGTVSLYNAKAVRASAGSVFRLPCVASKLNDAMRQLKKAGVRLVGTSSHEGVSLEESDLRGGVALVIGNEGAGLPKNVMAEMDEFVKIPQSENVESLNAGVAASVILYEAARQRRTQ